MLALPVKYTKVKMMATPQAFQVFCSGETPSVQPPASLSKMPGFLVPVRRSDQVQENFQMEPSTTDSATSLQRQLDERTAELKATREQLAKDHLDFQEFATVISNDLQAPLRAIAGFSQILKDEYAEGLDETADQYIDHVVNSSSRMRQLIQGVVEFARVSAKEKPFEKVDLNEVLSDVIQDLQKDIEGHHVVIQCDDLPSVFGDHDQLACLFKNVIENGITFNKSDNPVVHVRAEQVSSNWHIHVEDNGIGIAEKHLDKVFLILRRLHTREEFPGIGAGLAICRRIVDRHAGTIQLSSELEVGTRATISFPNASQDFVNEENGLVLKKRMPRSSKPN